MNDAKGNEQRNPEEGRSEEGLSEGEERKGGRTGEGLSKGAGRGVELVRSDNMHFIPSFFIDEQIEYFN